MKFRQLGVIGCGLIGCSFALAARRVGLVERIVGYSRSRSTTEEVCAAGIIDEAESSAVRAVSGSDLVLLAVPVGALPTLFRDIRPVVKSTMLVMDVGSTKQDVIAAAKAGLGENIDAFVPAHPIAGKESSGFQHAEPSLFQHRQVVLTPDDVTLPAQVQRATDVWKALGARVDLMTPRQHDATFAAVSHLPHLLAFAYVNGLLSQPDGREFMASGGPGFRDFSRIAAGDPAMWRDVCLANKTELLRQIQAFRQSLDVMSQAIENGDGLALAGRIATAAHARAAWQMPGDGSD